ncbi:pilus assembly protein [Pseudacidovorax intermedius]|uniref:pilus assembly protein n=1 Tax=Pseudacidovorax intermedius TaxID=433924 RepID=UPI00034503D9|nr:PilC/PilY family type IV pilus protein [Pseudacidovorax intermedius]
MNASLRRHVARARNWRVQLALLALGLVAPALGAVTDLATAPLETSSATLVKPNILYVLDNSGSMVWDFMPDWAGDYAGNDSLVRNSRFNGVYYDPAITYSPPLYYDGSSYPSMTAANTSSWTRVPYDGFGAMSTSNIPNTGTNNLFTNSNSGSTQNLTSQAYYYTFVPGEYCTAANLRTCNTQSAPSTTYPFPAYLRWCTSASLTNCQASRIDSSSAPATYTFERPAGMPATATISVSGFTLFTNTTVSSIKVNGLEILSGTTSGSTSTSTVASRIASNINNCTAAATGNCQTAGYSASASGSTVTVTAPDGSTTATPVVTRAGAFSVTPTAFSGGTPGSNLLTTITSSTASYTYPGTTTRASTRTDCTTNTTTCTYAEEMTNFANWWAYYRTRMQAMKSATSIAFNTLTANYRLGYMSINNSSGTTNFLNVADNNAGSGGQKQLWYSRLTTALPGGGTPLRFALSQAGQYYAAKVSSINGVTTTDPMQYACQRNYTLLSTDGYWNASTATGQLGVTVTGGAIGDRDGAESRPFLDGNAIADTLADVAEYYYVTDLRASAFGNTTNSAGTDVSSNAYSNKLQNMVTSTIGLGASGFMLYDPDYANATSGDYFAVANGTLTSSSTQTAGTCIWQSSGRCTWPTPVGDTQTAIDDLWHAAVNGRGTYYSAANAADIKAGLSNFLNTVDATTASSAAVAQSAQVLSTSTSSYTYSATFCSGKWFGDLARYPVDATTGATGTTPDWSLSGVGSDCASNSGALTTAPLLDNTAYTARTLFTYDAANNARVSFDWSSLTPTMQGYFQIASISSMSQLCTAGTSCLPADQRVDSTQAGTTTGAGGLNLVNYLRGDRSNEGTPRTRYYRSRTHVLGDIVNSAPVYVQAPIRNYADTGYAAYKSAQASRTGMVYVGANDGMLHAINASTGAEAWAYIPSVLLPNLYKLADKNYAANHSYFVDGQITQADVYANGSWRTILVGGLGGGGRAYWALDVTNPASPTVLWEFGSSSVLPSSRRDDDVGFTYGAPVVTKLSDGTWVAIVSSGYNNLSPGSGQGTIWVLNAVTGALIKKIGNGLGTSGTGTVTGCSAAPCPSGLSQISAWTDSTVDNTATQVYGGDLYGNLWRFDLRSVTASGGTAPVQLLAVLTDAANTRQPVTTTPELGLAAGQHVVFVGTGAYLGVTDVTTTQAQTMYAIKDPLTTSTSALFNTPRTNACTTGTITNCFMPITLTDNAGTRTASSLANTTMDFRTMNGWFADLPRSGERVDVDPILYAGTLVYVSNTPSNAGACTTGGSSFINYVNFATGLAVTGTTNVGALLSSAGVSSAATLSITPSGRIVATTKDSTGAVKITTVPTSTTATGTRRISWRRLQDGS